MLRKSTYTLKPGFHMIVTLGDLLRHIGDVSPISRRHMETMSLKLGFHMIVTDGDASATCPRSVTDIWKRSLL